MKKNCFLIFFLICYNLFAQQQAANWYFGYGAGMQFNLSNGTINVVDDGQLSTNEGCSTISDKFGNLLFYSDGSTVWNRNHAIMQNGIGLFGDASSTQSAIIVPKPDDENIYYIFTVDNSLDGVNYGLNYSIVDISLDGGLGAVVTKNINLLPICSEKISAVLKDCVTKSIWVITFASASGNSAFYNSFHAFEVNNLGVSNTAVVSTFGINVTDIRGYLKLSPDGLKLANANAQNGLYLYDFDVNTGIVSNQMPLSISSINDKPYGIEFSPDSRFLYVNSSNDYFNQSNPAQNNNPANHASVLTQFDVTQANVQATEITLDERTNYRSGLQLGPDGKIYRALSSTYQIGLPYLGVINDPNAQGLACNYQHNAISLAPNNSSQGLPPFIQSLFNTQIDIIQNGISATNLDLCSGENYTLISEDLAGATYTWTLDGNLLPESDYDLNVSQSGYYEVSIDENNGDCPIVGQALVKVFETPVANQPNDLMICDNDSNGKWSFNFNSQNPDVLGSQASDEFNVSYYESLSDAQNDQNEIIGSYENTSNPQQIFVRVKIAGLERCMDSNSITSFTIEVFNSPIANPVQDLEFCDDDSDGDYSNGQINIDLLQFNSLILNGQNDPNYSITYHSSSADAESGINSLPDNYYTNPFSDTIYVRIQNDINSPCFDTTDFMISINPRPEAYNTSLFQCDEDGLPDGFTIFNLNEAISGLTGGVSNVSTKYFASLTDAENSSNEIDGNAFNNFQNPQTIYVQVIDDTSGCYNLSELVLEVSATNANDAVLEICDDDGTEDGFGTFFLSDAESTILNGLPNNLDVQYYETYEDALLEINSIDNNYTNKFPYSQVIYVRIENENACYGINEIQLTVFDLPKIETELETVYCLNTFPAPIILTGGITNDSPSNYYYNWSTGENTSEIEINESGSYTVQVTNGNGCSKTRTITVLPSNIATFENIEVVDATQNNTISVLVSGEGDYEFALDNIFGPYTDSNYFDNVPAGIHTVYVIDKNNCGIVEELVSVVGFPRFFTPNNDGYNDTWQVKGVDSRFQPNTLIYIYDRYGKLVAQIDPTGPGWDGFFNGRPLPNDDYWFAITLEDGRIFKDHFSLKR
jgi:gliding motility-associated-like protein